MALVTLSAMFSNIKGKLGGGVFQNTQGGIAVRTKVTPVNRRTPLQELSRRGTFNLQNAWRSMTDAQRADWELFAQTYPKPQKKNPLRNINGQQYFLTYNDYRTRYNHSVMYDIDWNVPTLDALEVNLLTLPGNIFVVANRRINVPVEFLVLFMTWEVSPGLNNPGNRYKMVIFNTAYWNYLILNTHLTSIFGAVPSAGSTVFVKVAAFSRTSPYWTMFNESKVVIGDQFGIGAMAIGSTFAIA